MKILFICTHNACRSVLAEVIIRSVSQGKITTASAGSQPRGVVHPLTLEYLTKANFPIENLSSQSWDELQDFEPDAVITVCDSAAGESCPVWFGQTTKVHWGLPDPTKHSDDPIYVEQTFRLVMDTLRRRAKFLVKHLEAEAINNKTIDNKTDIKTLLEAAGEIN